MVLKNVDVISYYSEIISISSYLIYVLGICNDNEYLQTADPVVVNAYGE
jgi:hypothetical protein